MVLWESNLCPQRYGTKYWHWLVWRIGHTVGQGGATPPQGPKTSAVSHQTLELNKPLTPLTSNNILCKDTDLSYQPVTLHPPLSDSKHKAPLTGDTATTPPHINSSPKESTEHTYLLNAVFPDNYSTNSNH